MPGPISQNENFYSNDASSPKISWFQISFKSVQPFGHKKTLSILQWPIPYCVSLIMVTITSHIFVNIFRTVHFSAVKFTRGNGKNMNFLLIPKSPKVLEKSEAIGPGTFNRGIGNKVSHKDLSKSKNFMARNFLICLFFSGLLASCTYMYLLVSYLLLSYLIGFIDYDLFSLICASNFMTSAKES